MKEESNNWLPDPNQIVGSQLSRRQFIALATSASAGLILAACAPQAIAPTAVPPTVIPPTVAQPTTASASTLGPPETTKIRIALNSCDAPIMTAEMYLREEGFTDVQFTDALTTVAFAEGKADMGNLFATGLAGVLQDGMKIVGLGGIHPGCVEIWAPQTIASLKDLRGRTIVVQSKTVQNIAYANMAIVLKQAGVDPKDVNFVAQSDADIVKLYLEGKSDAVLVAAAAAEALKANSANKGHAIWVQAMDEPWSRLDCCFVAATQDWYRANPIATKRALRAIFRAADALPADRAAAAKIVTDKGLFGGEKNYANVHNAVNMLPFNWRDLDAEKSLRFHAQLLADTGLLKTSVDELVKSLDLQYVRSLRTELKKSS